MFPLLIVTSFNSFAGKPAPVTVDGGKINFAGSIVAAPCAVDNDSDSQVIKLGQVPTNRLGAAGSTSASVPFTIKLTGCDLSAKDATDATQAANYTKASITFNGGTVAGKNSILALASNGAGETTAQNVGIQILKNGEAVTVDGSAASSLNTLHNGNNEITFNANYVQVGGDKQPVVPGLANSSVNFMVNYE